MLNELVKMAKFSMPIAYHELGRICMGLHLDTFKHCCNKFFYWNT